VTSLGAQFELEVPMMLTSYGCYAGLHSNQNKQGAGRFKRDYERVHMTPSAGLREGKKSLFRD